MDERAALKKARDDRFATDKVRAAKPSFFSKLTAEAARIKAQLEGLQSPNLNIGGLGDLSSSISGVPDGLGVHGFFGSQQASTQLGAAMVGGKTTEQKQLEAQNETNELLKQMLDEQQQNTNNNVGFVTP